MDSWPTGGSSSSSPAKGRGKQKGKQNRHGNPFVNKRARFEQSNDDNPYLQLLYSSSELGLENRRQLRILFGLGVSTSLVPKHPVLQKAAAVETDPANPIMGDIFRWKVFVTELSKLEDLPNEIRQTLLDHMKSITAPEQLLGHVLMCTVYPTFDHQDIYKVHLKVSSSLQSVGSAVLNALTHLHAEHKFGPGPRTKAERLTADCLKAARGF
eukprot:TRINITY_DN42658_c0_g1_i1.p1 TRINITY_DN42658_c0_g1~~TRINITY_DN42658_c0_g1_i1.p1  ORF type:complete len:212 (+),score=22.79 TRINITY_DN42658_c0_g1_i1:162-797(+)